MKPLIEIKSVPISIELKTTAAQYKPADTNPQLEMSTEKGGLKMKSRHVKLELDTYQARKSAGNESATDSVKSYGDAGRQAAFQATGRYAQEGTILRNAQDPVDAIDQISDLRLKNNEHKTPNIRWIPEAPVDIQYEPANLDIQYETDKINFDFKQNETPMEFTPGSVELVVKQRPEVIIDYIGEPIYVPASANPNYEGE